MPGAAPRFLDRRTRAEEKLNRIMDRMRSLISKKDVNADQLDIYKERFAKAQQGVMRQQRLARKSSHKAQKEKLLASLPSPDKLSAMATDKRLAMLAEDPLLKTGYQLFARELKVTSKQPIPFMEYRARWNSAPQDVYQKVVTAARTAPHY